MSTKTKNKTLTTDKLTDIAQQAGVVLMSAAFTLGMLETPEASAHRAVMPAQPILALAGQNINDRHDPVRREREETAPHYVSYSESQRTPGRSGRY